MKQKLHVIYVPGLGDRGEPLQPKVVGLWRWYGVEAEMLLMNWDVKEPWETKFKRLLYRIDELAAEGKPIGLVGASAGASVVINAFAARPKDVVGVVCIAGKINRPETIGDFYRRKAPAFVESAEQCPKSLKKLSADQRRHILSLYALYDQRIETQDSRVQGGRNHYVPLVNHALTIIATLKLGASFFLSFLKRQHNPL